MSDQSSNPLGQSTTYVDQLDSGLLFAIPRAEKRAEIGVQTQALPFYGMDIWNAYEVSWLNQKGKPQVAVAEFQFPCSSPNLIESKSFKLYLNSYNQTQFDSLTLVEKQLTTDLSVACGADIKVSLQSLQHLTEASFYTLEGELIDDLDIVVESYTYAPDTLLNCCTGEQVSENLVSHLLKSNCLVTGQPDWASIQIQYRGNKIDRAALLKYLISFRQHNEFHEQCVERIYTDIMKYCKPEYLSVYARYTRRGGLDINPFRSTEAEEVDNIRLIRQ
ncbi:MAG TPA: NADPH-dependent 7-cyano-7-deazaguanine reductase QueF [Aeromonadales bacterium]|nr:NADPH-dependent 7-cyano-7-deazaguanine reductase QueF [Aeromonadales bacterium]